MTDILFMDIDGPMIPMRVYYLSKKVPGPVCIFDPVAIDHINRLLSARPELKIVISSTWRYHGRDKCEELLNRNNIDPTRLHDDWCTPRGPETRSQEIQAWLDAHLEIRKYVALEDEILDGTINQAQCSPEDGMSFSAVRQMCYHLGYDHLDLTKDDDTPEFTEANILNSLNFQLRRHDHHSAALEEVADRLYPRSAKRPWIIL